MSNYNIISLFTGAMGLDLGFEQAGFDIKVSIENNPICVKTIHRNRPGLPVIAKDIKEVTSKELLEVSGLKRNEVFAIIGGPPCQAFSTAGSRKALDDIRGSCVLEFVQKVKEIRPTYFLMENVRGLLSAAFKGYTEKKQFSLFSEIEEQAVPGGVLMYVLNLFEEAGYTVSFALFDSANYGAPQIRERVMLFGYLGKDRIPLPQPTHSEDGVKGTKKWKTVSDVFKSLEKVEHHYVDFPEKRKKYYRLLKAGENWKDLPENLQKEALGRSYFLGGGKTGFLRRLSLIRPSPTLVTIPTMPATDLCHPTELRPLSVEEYAAIQGFPKGWQFEGKLVDIYRQIGNAVPIQLGYVAGKTIKDFHEGRVRDEVRNGVSYSRYKGTTDEEFKAKFRLGETLCSV